MPDVPSALPEETIAASDVEFEIREVEALRDIVYGWIGEGFCTPPYTDAQYTIFEELGLDDMRGGYDTRRPVWDGAAEGERA